ncbi:hypothetical protein KIH86_28110 [Paenibacillus sp. HN-1]|uniref:hypothetical protein n=1 Tax=Paenibacillus TaxID=44249 RepID=UPI001CA8C2B8|nr:MULTISPECIES: hypothetical protein [Paenibacillus]MBY9078780.1 hypothetical protein [Paenibacillus sp. CGMCC 1.18879]MBY9088060.1 hypothetical protein [Paenibacillus sinensis]
MDKGTGSSPLTRGIAAFRTNAASRLSMNPHMNHQEALEKLYARTERIGQSVDMKQIKKMFAKSLKAYQRFG